VAPGQRLAGHLETLRGQVRLHHAAVAGVGEPLDEPAPLEAVDELGHVGTRDAELVSQSVQAGPALVAAAQHLENLELGIGEPIAPGVPVELAARRAGEALEGVGRAPGELGAPVLAVGRFLVHHLDGTTHHPRLVKRLSR
jgi:hypothetical protein